MVEPGRIVVALLDRLQVKGEDVSDLTVLAAGAVACMAAIGNGQPEAAVAALRSVASSATRLRPETREVLDTIAVEIHASLRAGKRFTTAGRVRVSTDGATGTGGDAGQGDTPEARTSSMEVKPWDQAVNAALAARGAAPATAGELSDLAWISTAQQAADVIVEARRRVDALRRRTAWN